jgi:hypothetical protein
MHVRSSGDPVEITGERENLTINCDISECTHATTHTLDFPMRNAQPRKEAFELFCRFSITGIAQRRQVVWMQIIGTCIC